MKHLGPSNCFSAILGDLSQLSTDLATMDANVKAFTGSLRGVLVITLDEAKVEQDLARVTDDVRGSLSPFNEEESDELVNAIVALDPVVVGLLYDVVAKVLFALTFTCYTVAHRDDFFHETDRWLRRQQCKRTNLI